MTPREQALAIVHRVASARGWTVDMLMSHAKKCAPARVEAYRALISELGWSQARVGRLFGRTDAAVNIALSKPQPKPYDPERLEDLERQLRRLTGCEISHMLAVRLGLPQWQAIFLSILVESYPRTLSREVMCELYDDACTRLGFGQRRGVDLGYVKQFSSLTNRAMAAQGLPEPVRAVRSIGYTLNEDAAFWLSSNFGRPFIASIAAQTVAA